MASTKRALLDFMGGEELAANLFRITQTESKLKKEGTYGQKESESVAKSVGQEVRRTMLKISGTHPEDLRLTEDIKKVKTSLRHTYKGLKKIDD